MGGCFSGQKGLESENAPVQLPVSPKADLADPAPVAATAENVVETPKEALLVDVSDTKEAEVVAEHVAEEKGLEAVSDVKEEAKVAEVETAHSGTEDKTSNATAAV